MIRFARFAIHSLGFRSPPSLSLFSAVDAIALSEKKKKKRRETTRRFIRSFGETRERKREYIPDVVVTSNELILAVVLVSGVIGEHTGVSVARFYSPFLLSFFFELCSSLDRFRLEYDSLSLADRFVGSET